MTSKQLSDRDKLIICFWLRKTCLSQKTPLDLINVILEYTKVSIIFDLIDDNDNVWKNIIDYIKLKQYIILKPKVNPPHESSYFCTTPFHADLENKNKDLVISTTFKVDPPQPYVGFVVDCPKRRTKNMSLMFNRINTVGYCWWMDDGGLWYIYPGQYTQTMNEGEISNEIRKIATSNDIIKMSFYPSIGYFKWFKNGKLIHSKNLEDLIKDTKRFCPKKKIENIQNLAIYFVISFCVYSKYSTNDSEKTVLEIDL